MRQRYDAQYIFADGISTAFMCATLCKSSIRRLFNETQQKDYIYRKNDFAEVSKNLDTDLKIISLNNQNNYIGNSSMSNAAKNFDVPTTRENPNYFDSLTKLFLDLYVAKFCKIILSV